MTLHVVEELVGILEFSYFLAPRGRLPCGFDGIISSEHRMAVSGSDITGERGAIETGAVTLLHRFLPFTDLVWPRLQRRRIGK